MKPLDIVEIDWIDSATFAEGKWLDETELAETITDTDHMMNRTTGYLIAENDEWVAIGHTTNLKEGNEMAVCGSVVIPKLAIYKRRKVGVSK